ncbi:MAG TPA: TlyA family RNA methyltransferase, partial [Bryobacteraceae bacterium]|nr:TlyA family RNA methyltransferase [Bryobacteraceae bacterium]
MPRRRIDQVLTERGLADSRSKAQALILAGSVLVDGQKVEKPGQVVREDCAIDLLGQTRFVSRGGLKLEAALDRFGIAVTGRICLDVGASTGGFTDCLLQRGALRVHTVDVGPSQLAWRIQTDPRVVVHDHTNARYITPQQIGESCSLCVCDVSFISVTLILPALPPVLTAEGQMVILVKPQFEAGRDEVGKGGIVRDPQLHQAACARVQQAVEALGFAAE